MTQEKAGAAQPRRDLFHQELLEGLGLTPVRNSITSEAWKCFPRPKHTRFCLAHPNGANDRKLPMWQLSLISSWVMKKSAGLKKDQERKGAGEGDISRLLLPAGRPRSSPAGGAGRGSAAPAPPAPRRDQP